MDMPLASIVVGIGLVILGLGSYFGLGRESVTAFIPAFFGVPLVVLGAVAAKSSGKLRMHLMHAAAMLALLGLIGSFGGVPDVFKLIGGAELARPKASIAKAIMALLCVVLLALSVKSFISARMSRKAAGEQS
jgi:hypothetical protein